MGGMKKGNDVRRMNILHPTTSSSRYPKTADQAPPTLYIKDDIITMSSRIALLEISDQDAMDSKIESNRKPDECSRKEKCDVVSHYSTDNCADRAQIEGNKSHNSAPKPVDDLILV